MSGLSGIRFGRGLLRSLVAGEEGAPAGAALDHSHDQAIHARQPRWVIAGFTLGASGKYERKNQLPIVSSRQKRQVDSAEREWMEIKTSSPQVWSIQQSPNDIIVSLT